MIGSAALAGLATTLTVNTMPNWLIGVLIFCVFTLGMWVIYGIIYSVYLIPFLWIPIREKIGDYLYTLRIFLTKKKLVYRVRSNLNLRWNVKALTVGDLNAKIEDLKKMIENKTTKD